MKIILTRRKLYELKRCKHSTENTSACRTSVHYDVRLRITGLDIVRHGLFCDNPRKYLNDNYGPNKFRRMIDVEVVPLPEEEER